MKSKFLKKCVTRVLVFAMVMTSICSDASTYANAAAKVKLNKTSLSLKKGKSAALTLKNNKATVKWSSSNAKIAAVSSIGKVKAKNYGIATVTAKANGKKYQCKVYVYKKAYKVAKNKTVTVKNKNAKWKVESGKNLVSIQSKNKTGAVIKGKKAGTAYVSAKAGKKTALYKITVKETTVNPTEQPTAAATGLPTASAIGQPTTYPTGQPTTTDPTGQPTTTDPTGQPTTDPTGQPTTDPTGQPTTDPTGQPTTDPTEQPTEQPTEEPITEGEKLSYDDYELQWSDDFDGDTLNRDDWNVEEHAPGWVNSELQEYVDSDKNIYVKDGNLVLKPIKTVDKKGNVSYTSGRVNTQNKHDFKYGLFEVRAKVPEGKGYLPAFWMMPTDENLYGQWPRCGEIDIMEVMGQQNNKLYGTIHYGNPHNESQGTHVLSEGNYTDEYHTFSCEWEPGKIKWYVDGILFHEESDWYSTTEGQGTVTYPAPFDQPFYMILNLAVGGSWVTNPDENTDFENAAYVIDYVKAYQKDSYDENVTKPIKEVILRDPDKNGNYIINGDFATAESLTDDTDWAFMNANGGEATAEIKNNAIFIDTTNAGEVDYSVQLVQPNLPMQKGATYEISFDAYADEARTMGVKVSAPDNGWAVYGGPWTTELTTSKQTYKYSFRMMKDDDANGRLEFNMGAAGSTAGIHISNVKVEKTDYKPIIEGADKTILADGNYVYNGGFQEGEGRLGYWEVVKAAGADVFVTNDTMDRRLKIVNDGDTDVIVKQPGLAITGGVNYVLSFDAQADSAKELKVVIAGQTYIAALTSEKDSYSYKITTGAEIDNKDIAFYAGKGTTYLDNVRLVEDTLIKNSSFNAGFAGYEPYVDSSAGASYVVDSLNEDNAANFGISNTGDMDWKIQLKQNNVEMEQGQWYRLKLDVKSTLDRKFMYAIQENGGSWTPYVQKIVDITEDWQTFTTEFQMKEETDLKAVLSLSMGAVGGIQITERHDIYIDNISLEKIDEPEFDPSEPGENLLSNSDFSGTFEDAWTETIANWEDLTAEADRTIQDGSIIYDIKNPGTDDWHVQLKQSGIRLEAGETYEVTFKATSTVARTIKTGVMSTKYDWYGGSDVALDANKEKTVTYEFTMEDGDSGADFFISMGQIKDVDTPASVITISDLSLVKK